MFLLQKIRPGFFRINDAFGTATVNGKKFNLDSIHLKSPSEHAIMGGGFPAEI
jgi:carbonic anhydrase